jgi:hypothetical protein
MTTLKERLLAMALLAVIGISLNLMANGMLDSAKISLSWKGAADLQGFTLIADSVSCLIPGAQVRTIFDYLGWEKQGLTRLEFGPCWEDVILESPKTDNSSLSYAFGNIGGGVSLSWDNGMPLNIPKAFMVPRQGVFAYIRTRTQTEGEGFVEVKNYYLEDSCQGMEVKGKVQVKSFYFHLYGLRFSAPDLLSQHIQAKLQNLDSISTSSTLSWMFGIELDETLYGKNLSEGIYQYFFSQNWFGEVTLQNQGNALTLGCKLDENHIRPYIKIAMSLFL